MVQETVEELTKKNFKFFDDKNIYQSLNFNLIYPDKYFIYVYGNKYLIFTKKKLGFLIFAKVLLPDNDFELIEKFVLYCKKKRWIYYILSEYKFNDLIYEKPSPYTYKFTIGESKIKKGQKCNIKKAKKEGVVCKVLSTENEWRDFIEIYNLVFKDGQSILEKNFKKIFSLKDKNFILIGAYLNEKLISGTLYYIIKDEAILKIQATDLDSYNCAPVPLSFKYALEVFNERKIKKLDLNVGFGANFHKENSKAFQINKFKSRWGDKVEYYYYMPKLFAKIISIIRKVKFKYF